MFSWRGKIPVYWWRGLVQAFFLFLFLFLFRRTDYPGRDELPYAVNLFFRFDPLALAAVSLAAREVEVLLLPALVVVALTLILGRFFCGWICPLGTLLDMWHRLVPPRGVGGSGRYGGWKYYLLAAILVCAFLGLPLVGYFDPFSLLVRGLALAFDPAFFLLAGAPFDFIYHHAEWATPVSEPVYSFLKEGVLAFRQMSYFLALPSFLLLVLIFALNLVERRFWCRNFCPLGGMLALFSRRPLLRLHPGRSCREDCRECVEVCRMNAIRREDGKISSESCTLCLDCVEKCPKSILSFKFKPTRVSPPALGISRRGFASTLAASLLLPAVFKTRGGLKNKDPFLLRPPGAAAETEFLGKCLRCGECMKVCITNGLQPAGLSAGAEAMFSPILVPRVGYCEYNCTLCGQVCPSGAIARLSLAEKQKTRIGRARFDKNLCLPYAKGIPCLVCEEHCPLPDKAIKLRPASVPAQEGRTVELQQPYVVDRLCIGCGICENKCPVPGSAVRVTREGESRDPEAEADRLNEGAG